MTLPTPTSEIYVDLVHTPKPDDFTGDRWQPWSALILGANHEPLFRSTERWTNKADAKHAINIAFGSTSIVYLREAGEPNVVLRQPQFLPPPAGFFDDDDEQQLGKIQC